MGKPITIYIADEDMLRRFDNAIGITKRSSMISKLMKEYVAKQEEKPTMSKQFNSDLDAKARAQFREMKAKGN